jgi:flagellar motor component MotA
MSRPLPPRPNLLHLKHQAKDLRQAHQQGDAEAYARIGEFLPRCADADAAAIAGPFSLQEAQHVIACEYGFKHWEMLCTVIKADLDLLANLSNDEIQQLLRQCDQRDFVKAIKGGGAVVSERFLSNMSERVRTFITEEVEYADFPPAEELEAARQQLLQTAAKLAVQGTIQWPDQGSEAIASMDQAVRDVNFDLLAGLSDREAQRLMREVDFMDLTVALLDANTAVQDLFLSNVTARVAGVIRAEMEVSQADKATIDDTRKRILLQAVLCTVQGEIQWPDGRARANGEKITTQFQPPERLEQIAARSLEDINTTDLTDLCKGLAAQVQNHGILSLNNYADSIEDPFIREALQLAVDGCEPALLRDMMETRLDYALLQRQKTRGQIVIEATMGLVSGDNPLIVRHKLSVFIAEPTPGWAARDLAEATVDELAAQVSQTPPQEMTLEQIVDLYSQAARLARTDGLASLGPLREALQQERKLEGELMRRGLDLALDETEPARILKALQTQLKTWLDGTEKAYRMVIEGVCALQSGKKPEEVAEAVRLAAA